MRLFFAYFFLFIILSNVAVTFVNQLQGEDMCELSKFGEKETDEKTKTEKEKETFDTFDTLHFGISDIFWATIIQKEIHYFHNDFLISQFFGSLPELPPDAL
jgi:hypothetical protein